MAENNLGSAKNLKQQQLVQSNQEKEKEDEIVNFFQLYRFAQGSDKVLIVIGIIAALATGCGFPFFGYIWGLMTDAYKVQTGWTSQDTVNSAATYRNAFLIVGAGTFVLGWIAFACWIIVGQRMALKCRKAYLKSLFSQQMGYFDLTSEYKISSQFQSDTISYQRAIGQKVGSLVMIFGMFICGMAIAFAIRWTLTLIIFCAMPFLGLAGFLFIYLIELKNINFLKFYEKAGSRAQQAISAIKTVKMLNGQQHQYNLFQKALNLIEKKVPKYSLYGGMGDGFFYIAQFFAYAWAFWYGSHCAQDTNVCPTSATGSKYTAGQVVSVFFALFVGSYNFMQLVPSIQKIYGGMLAAHRLYAVIDREPVVKSPQSGIKLQNIRGIINFQNVTFSYPKDKSTYVIKNLNLQLNVLNQTYINYQGQEKSVKSGCCGPSYTTHKQFSAQKINNKQYNSQIVNSNALVGQSGCGKSTILQLIMRFYDPDEGRITVDGVDLRDLDLNWYRNQIGYVGQQPVLFATSIKQNIKYGKPNATDQQIFDALKKSQAYDFVMSLQDKQNTYVGYGGGQLSGGQKQRIAIARAIIRNPAIYILDEATSALDRKNQRLIQKTLDQLIQDRTSITVAHRVNTIMNCNRIYVLDKGKLIQQGSFENLTRYKSYKKQAKQKSPSKIQITNKNKVNQQQSQSDQQIEKQVCDDHQNLFKQKDEFKVEDKTLSRQQKIQKQEELIRKGYSKGIYSKLFSYTRGNRFKLFIGAICACGAGAAYPVFTIFLAQMVVGIFQLYNNSNDSGARDKVDRNGLIITCMGVAVFFLNLLEYYLFSIVGEKVTKKIRLQTYHKILRMPIPFFDMPRNSGAAVASRLSIDSQLVNGLTSLLIAVMLHNFATIIAAFIISFIYEWRIGLLGLAAMPLMLLGGFINMLFYGGSFGDKSEQVYKQSSRLVSESVMNIRTVKALAYENILTQKYDQLLVEPAKFAIKKGNIIGALYGFSQFLIMLCFAILFWLGAIFKRDNANVQTIDIFTAIFAIVWAGWTAGNNFFFVPDISQGQKAAANLFYILDRKDEQQCQIQQGSKLIKSGIKGNIHFENVSFRYASRNQYVFKHINLDIKQGDKIAFVGPSGCGKSTIINLLLRFYCQNKGNIIIDGKPIEQYDINYLRSCFGVVGQQPVLFNATFRENIKYNSDFASEEDIIKAATQSNAISFILGNQAQPDKLQNKQKDKIQDDNLSQQIGLPKKDGKGFDKNVGARGSHISGGQKQRIAIARAILKNPQILLLDQATSALDSANQKIVQQSLDKLMAGRTSINIAHRIQTIKNSKQIYVFNEGKIVQKGNYKQLVNNQSYFYMLQKGITFT